MIISKKKLMSIDKTYSCVSEVYSPTRYREIYDFNYTKNISLQGGGNSIAACSFSKNSATINMKNFNRILEFDPRNKRIKVEPGITLKKLNEFIHRYNLYLPVLPGYPYITIGGCTAANVHGKNPYIDGTFKNYVDEFEIYQPNKGVRIANQSQNQKLFALTQGALGLTGIIISITLRLKTLPCHHILMTRQNVRCIKETIEVLIQNKEKTAVLHSWNDLTHFDKRMGRGYVFFGNFYDCSTNLKEFQPKNTIGKGSIFKGLMNSFSLPLLNKAYYRSQKLSTSSKIITTNEAFFPWTKRMLYFKMIGNRGVIESQVLVPMDKIFDYVKAFSKLLKKSKTPCSLASFKIFNGEAQYLQFDGKGICFSIQIPKSKAALIMLGEQDKLNLEFGAITNIYKDSRLSSDTAMKMFSEYSDFKEQLLSLGCSFLTNAIKERLNL